MTMLSSLKSFFAVQQAKRWSDDERKALVRFFYDVITADGIVSAARSSRRSAPPATHGGETASRSWRRVSTTSTCAGSIAVATSAA